jgi:hypothetical protein
MSFGASTARAYCTDGVQPFCYAPVGASVRRRVDVNAHDGRVLQSRLSQLERETLETLEPQLKQQARAAARKCAEALLTYIRDNPRLLYAKTLPKSEAEELRGCLTTYVATLRALATPPERVIVAVKDLVRDAASDTAVDIRPLTSAAVEWAIQGYYPESLADYGTPRSVQPR